MPKRSPIESNWAAAVLAAGRGTRMRSRTPKVLHALCGRPMVSHVLGAVHSAEVSRAIVVVPPHHSGFQKAIGNTVEYAIQEKPLGTGHALLAVFPSLDGKAQHLLTLPGDAPLLRGATLQRLMAHHLATGADVTILTATNCPQDGLGRVVRDGTGTVVRIVEERDATTREQRISEVNSGVYCFRTATLWPRLVEVSPSARGEVYLTDLVALMARAGGRVETLQAEDPWEVSGVNDRSQLANAEAIMRQRICQRWMLEGVTILHPESTFIDATVGLGKDTVLYPGTHLYGNTRIGQRCRVGPNALIFDSALGDQCHVMGSVLEGAVLESKVEVGPYCHLRPGTYLERGVHLGNFVEVKKSRLGRGVKAGHFTYLGDAIIGAKVNIGAGTVTCNFDGVRKLTTKIGEGAFIGCDTMLVAPVKVGARSVTGAGAVVTRDVPDDTLVVGMPARPRRRIRKPRSPAG